MAGTVTLDTRIAKDSNGQALVYGDRVVIDHEEYGVLTMLVTDIEWNRVFSQPGQGETPCITLGSQLWSRAFCVPPSRLAHAL